MMRPMQRDILGIGVVAFSVGDKVMVVGISPGVRDSYIGCSGRVMARWKDGSFTVKMDFRMSGFSIWAFSARDLKVLV